MVDNLSVEALIKRLLEESQSCSYPYDNQTIKRRYKDAALVLFKEQQEEEAPARNYLTFGTRRSSAVSQYGNTPIVIRRSRSSNGELATVAQQLAASSLKGRTSKSDYTLVETAEDHGSDTDTDHSSSGRDRSASVVKSPKLHKSTDQTDGQAEGADDGREAGARENKKSFSHYDLSSHKATKEQHSVENGESREMIENDLLFEQTASHSVVSNTSTQVHNDSTNITATLSEGTSITTTQPGSTARSPSLLGGMTEVSNQVSRDEEQVDHDAILREYVLSSSSSDKHSDKNSNVVELKIVESTDHLELLDDPNAKSPDYTKSLTTTDIMQLNNQDLIYIDAKSPPLAKKIISCESPLGSSENLFLGKGDTQREFAGNLLCSVPEPEEKAPVSLYNNKLPGNDTEESWKSIEKSKQPPENHSEESRKSIGNSIQSGKESTFGMKEPAEMIAKIEKFGETLTEGESQETTTDNQQSRHSADNNQEPQEDITASLDLEPHGRLINLPLRSPTPPKRSPRWTPRSPKSRDKKRQRHSSLVLPPEAEIQQESLLLNGTRSASPNTKVKEGKFFSFSVKQEKSKSVSSLSVKKSKDRRKMSAINFREDQLNLANADKTVSPGVESPCEVYGKRVGVRSMVIDGTIKRNFIVIHPSDESETIGLAPLSPPNSSSSSRKTGGQDPSEALSSIKSRISGVNMDNLERISSRASMKEALIRPTGIPTADQQNHTRSSKATRSLRMTKSKKSAEHKGLRGSQSLPSDPNLSTSTGSLVLKSPTSSSSEMVCHTSAASTSGLSSVGTRTVSRLCVIQ